MKPSNDPKADELRNSNLNHPDENGTTQPGQAQQTPTEPIEDSRPFGETPISEL